MAVAAQPLAVRELNPGALERPTCQIACQRLFEALARVSRFRKERARMPEAQRDPCAGPLACHRLDLSHPGPRGRVLIDVARCVRQIRDEPRTDHRVMRRVVRIEYPIGVCVRVRVAIGGERGQYLAELRERHRDLRARGRRDELSFGRQAVGLLVVPAHRRDDRDRRVGGGHPLRFRELLGKALCFLGGGDRDVPIAEPGGHARVQDQQAWQVSEPSLGAQPIDCRREEVVTQVEGADDERGRAEEASGVGVDALGLCRACQAFEYRGRVPERIGVRVDREDARVFGVRVPEPSGCVNQRTPRRRARINPPRAGGDEPEEIDVKIVIARRTRVPRRI
jgi:hypothetical protein